MFNSKSLHTEVERQMRFKGLHTLGKYYLYIDINSNYLRHVSKLVLSELSVEENTLYVPSGIICVKLNLFFEIFKINFRKNNYRCLQKPII